jgi:hypothetical protein
MSKLITYKIGIIGVGVLGTAIYETLSEKVNIPDQFKTYNIDIKLYDKYKNIGCLEDLVTTDFIFLCLPTEYNNSINEYDKSKESLINGVWYKNDVLGITPSIIEDLSRMRDVYTSNMHKSKVGTWEYDIWSRKDFSNKFITIFY